jgi:hypothetical protein
MNPKADILFTKFFKIFFYCLKFDKILLFFLGFRHGVWVSKQLVDRLNTVVSNKTQP